MYANVVTMRYKNAEDVDKAIEKMKGLTERLPSLRGFRDFTLVRVGDRETVNVVRFETEENALKAREEMIPRVKEMLGPLLAGDPEPRTGEVLSVK